MNHKRLGGWIVAVLLIAGGCASESVSMRDREVLETTPPVEHAEMAREKGSTSEAARLKTASTSSIEGRGNANIAAANAAIVTPRPAPQGGHGVSAIGYSRTDKPIVMYTFGDPGQTPVLILGGIHGNEPTSAGVCHELLLYLKVHPEAVRGRTVYLIPEANPDGLRRGMRTNERLVDLNRNFPSSNWKKTRRSSYFGGDDAATEPETIALIGLIDRLRPARICSVHAMDEPCNNFDGPAEALARLMACYNRYEVRNNIGYPTPGSFGSWAGNDRHIPIITLELPRREKTPASWQTNREALLAFIRGA